MRQRMKRVMGVLLSLALAMGMMISSSKKASAYEDGPYESFVNTTTQVKFNGKSWTIIEDNSTAVDAGTVTLLAADERGFETCYFNTDENNNKYSESLVKKFLDDVIAIGSFKDVADAIEDTENGKLYLLSVEEAEALPKEVRKIKFSSGNCTNVSEWWLRTPGSNSKRAACVYGRSGSINSMGPTVDHSYGVRPALKLKLSAVTFDPSSNTFIYGDTIPGGNSRYAVEMHRLYNPNSGEHFYTGNVAEKDFLVEAGWSYEGVAWNAPDFSLNPVYRLYDKNSGAHRYTMDEDKRDGFIAEGWSDEGVGWYSDETESIPVFGLYNKNALQAGAYHFTADVSERDSLIELGWIDEGIGWYAIEKIEKNPVEIGDTVLFGAYEQDNNFSNGKEAIEWKVLAKEGNKALVISNYALDAQPYNTQYTDITWETCSLRKWLNGTFISNAFSSYEQNMIQTTTVTAEKNPEYSTPPGNNTKDKVFLLNIPEANRYFSSDEARICEATEYAKAQGVYASPNYSVDGKATCWWWLRSPGSSSDSAANVRANGSVHDHGYAVNYDELGVRPALWINLGY